MNYVYMANSRLGLDVARWLAWRNTPPVAVVVHPPERGRDADEIVAAFGLPPARVFCASTFQSREAHERLAALRPDVGVSVLFDYLVKPHTLAMFSAGCVNLHPSLLPYNRGQYPNVWSIVEGTPAGVTLHYMDAGIDTGDIAAQREVAIDVTDTGESLYRKLEAAAFELFCDNWPRLIEGRLTRVPQVRGAGTYHRTRDVEALDRIDLDRNYTARDLINVLRARTFPPYDGAYFEHDGKRVYLRLSLETERPAT